MTEEQIIKAEQWQRKHKEHVAQSMRSILDRGCYEPAGSDAGSPNLWKSAHWRWFYRA